MVFSFSFKLDGRRKLDNGNYPIKVNLHDKRINRNHDFSIKPVVNSEGKLIEFQCSKADWESIWVNKDKKNSFGEVVGETTVHGNRFTLRTLLKVKQDVLNEIISKEGVDDYKEVRRAFYDYKPSDAWDNVYSALEELAKYHEDRESYNYAQGFRNTINNFVRYLNGEEAELEDVKPLRFTEITVEWLTEYEQTRRKTVKADAVRKDLVNLRTAYNKAAKKHDILKLKYPFGIKNDGYVMPKSSKRNVALSKDDIQKLVEFSSDNWYLQNSRDFILFSYGLRGANLTDIARLEKNASTYIRKKTKDTSGAEIKVRDFNDTMLDIIERHKGKGKYLFNIIEETDSEKEKLRKIKAKAKQVSDQAKNLAKLLGLDGKLTYQWARHTTGHHLASSGMAMKAIQEMYGHTSQRTTEGYVKSVFNDKEEEIDDILEL